MQSSSEFSHNIEPKSIEYFSQLAQWLEQKAALSKTPLLVGINGAQGSGKSTLGRFLASQFQEHSLRACVLSIDDFYLGRIQRQQLAEHQHPLFATRGVPGTHHIDTAITVIESLRTNKLPVRLPRFNKATDDPFPQAQCPVIKEPQDIVILEGWCVGTPPEPESALVAPINELERTRDVDARWRKSVNQALATDYQKLFGLIDVLIQLKAPSFDCVAAWRLEQEQALAASLTPQEKAQATGIMSEQAIKNFIAFYQRLTQVSLKVLPDRADIVFHLDAHRHIVNITGKENIFSRDQESK